MFAIFEPKALPIAIFDFPSKLDIMDITISGDEVASPIKIKLERKYEILYFSEIFSVDETSMFAPKLIKARPAANNKSTEMVIRKLMLKLNNLHLSHQFQNLLLSHHR